MIVGVSVDEAVQTYKNKRPIICYDDRAAIVGAIRFVDQVVPQISMNKMEAWYQYHFDVLFHGSDWQNSEMYNKIVAEFKEIGVDVVFFAAYGRHLFYDVGQ